MSKAQGDSYKTWTDHKLNAYRARLDAKLIKLADHREKWYRVGAGWILVEERNRMVNPNGSWKWDGWKVEAHEYIIRVFPGESVEIKDGKPHVIGWSQVVKVVDDDKDYANEYFNKVAIPLARNLKTWIPKEANNGLYLDYEGRKPSGMITMNWDGDTYFFTLVVDGKDIFNSYSREECAEEAIKIGAELEETHTP